MRLIKKLIILSVTFGLVTLPSFAKFEGGVSKTNFYDLDKTIMNQIEPNNNLKTGKYWETNLFYGSKYRPLFMLSNKELYNLMPRENVSVIQRIATPSVYNISLKTNSIKAVSLAQPAKKFEPPKKTVVPVVVKKPDMKMISMYEEAKNPDVDLEKKVETAALLKDSKNISNYDLAIDLLDDVTRKEPYNAYAFYLKGELYVGKSDTENAMKNYVEALKLNPTSKQSCIGIAKILEPTNKELARKYYDRAELSDKE